MTDHNDGTPSIREIAALTARLRDLSNAGAEADPTERAAFLVDKDALLARVDDARAAGSDRSAAEAASAEEVLARGIAGGYAMVGPSARTWSVDPATGVPVGPVSEDEHRQVRDLIAHERLEGAGPGWRRCDDGTDEIVALVIPGLADLGEDVNDEDIDDDGWFTDGYDAAHAAYLDELGEVDVEPPTEEQAEDASAADGRRLPPWPAGTTPVGMLDGIAERRDTPARPDDPVEISRRLDTLRQQIRQRDAADTVSRELVERAPTDPATESADGDDAERGR